jgi:hypothetical protein
LIDDEAKAKRLALAIAEDLALYNEPALAAPVRDRRDLLVRLAGPIAEGRELFDSRIDRTRVSPELFDTALAEVLLVRAVVDSGAPMAPGDFSSIQRTAPLATTPEANRGLRPIAVPFAIAVAIVVIAIVVSVSIVFR